MIPLKLLLLTALNFLISLSLFSQYFGRTDDTINVKYIFWSSPKYSLNESLVYRNSNSLLSGAYKEEFKNMFNIKSEEYLNIKKSQSKYLIGNLGCGGAGGLCFAFALNSDTRNTRNSLFTAGSALLICDIVLGINAFKDLKNAVKKRNSRIKKIKGYS